MPFLTALDSRALVKGSRDPLGVQPIWTRLGRYVVGNLTTVTDSVRDFSILLWGLRLCELAAAKGYTGSDAHLFLRWEQLAGYVRHRHLGQRGFRGTERVAKQVALTGGRITLSHEPDFQILGDQQTYGLWGLYTMSARASGLVLADRPRLTPVASAFLEAHDAKLLASHGVRERELVDLVAAAKSDLDLDGKHSHLGKALAVLLRPQLRTAEAEFYRTHLLHGRPADPTAGRQRRLSEIMATTSGAAGFAVRPSEVGWLAGEARATGDAVGQGLAGHLERIRAAESVLAVANELFSWCLGANHASLAELAAQMQAQWGARVGTIDNAAFASLRPELQAAAPQSQTADVWCDVAKNLTAGDYAAAIEGLLAINRLVMHARGGAPWAELRDGKLAVQYKDEAANLPTAAQLPELWRFSYFLEPLRVVTRAVQEAA